MVDDGELVLPAGMTVADLKWAWKPTGTPWIDPLKEALADIAGMEAGIESPQGVADRTGERDPFDVIQEQAEYLKARRDAGLPDPPWITPKATGGTGTAATVDGEAKDDGASATAGSARTAAAAHLASLPAEPEKST
jgi:capsid protein